MFWLGIIAVVLLVLVKFDGLERRVNKLEHKEGYPNEEELKRMNLYEGTE